MLPPRATVVGAPVIVSWRFALGGLDTIVTELLLVTGSGVSDDTLAVAVSGAVCPAASVPKTLTTPDCPAVSLVSENVRVFPVPTQALEQEAKVKADGNVIELNVERAGRRPSLEGGTSWTGS